MRFTAITALALAATAFAAPAAEAPSADAITIEVEAIEEATTTGISKRATGSNQNGSIFNFGDAKKCSRTLRDFGACGISTYFKNVNQGASFVAMPADVFDRYGASQHNKLCGKTITMTRNGVTRTAIVADRNLSNDHSIDMCLDIWQAFGGHDNDGTLIRGFKWTINGV